MTKTRSTAADFSQNPELADVIERNIQTMLDVRAAEDARRTTQDRLADALTRFSGNLWFVYLHTAWFLWWIATNVRWIPGPVFDPFPFGLLTLIVSLEAIFLATFVLISQNREAAVANVRADLDLQIDLLAEHEVTRALSLITAIARKLNVEGCDDPELAELRRDVTLREVIREMHTRAVQSGRRRVEGGGRRAT